MKTIKRTLALALLLGAGAVQAATVPCMPGPGYWDADCYYDLPNGTNTGNPTEPVDPVDPVDPSLPNAPPSLDPNGAGSNPFGSTFGSDPIFFVSAPAQDFPGFTPSAPSEVPLPPSAWLLGTALFGLISIARRRREQVIVVDAPATEA